MAKRILVTGGTGFIGRHAIKPLIEKGFEVTLLVNKARIKREGGIFFTTCDLLDPKAVKNMIQDLGPEYLLHLAWDVMPGYKDANHNVDWMNASLNLIQQFSNTTGGRKVVIAGTCFDHEPTTLYGTCKRSLWNILNYAKFAESLELAYGRIYYLYGPHEHPSRLVPVIINGLLKNPTVNIRSMAAQTFNLSYVQDVADAFVQAIDGDVMGEFDIMGRETSALTIADTIIDLMDANKEVIFGKDFENYRGPYQYYNSQKLGERKLTSLVKGMNRTIEWWKALELQGM